jgi:putative PIN family toxin of toxin-antitoxin system
MREAPLVVLDTNVVLSALRYRGGAVGRLREAWQAARFVPLVSTHTALELVRVLAYPKFKLNASEQETLLADYMPWVRVVKIPHPPPSVPACRDAFDVPFLHLAAAGRAQFLVTGDKDLLALADTARFSRIVTVEAFCGKTLATGSSPA